MMDLKRREFLKASAAFAAASAAGGFGCVEIASAQPIRVPMVDKLTMRVLIDFEPRSVPASQALSAACRRSRLVPAAAATTARSCTTNGACRSISNQCSGSEQRTILLDFGYSPDALLNNIEILRVDPSKINALIVSHGHFDHFGGLQGFLDKYRGVLPADLKLYAGGEDNFCQRFTGPARASLPNGARSTAASLPPSKRHDGAVRDADGGRRPRLHHRQDQAQQHRAHPAEHASSSSRMKDGLGCNASHYLPAELQGKIVPDEHVHEHATCFNIKDRGTRGDQLLRPCRHRQLGAAGAGGVGRAEGPCGRRRLPSRPGARATTSSRWSPRSRSSSPT